MIMRGRAVHIGPKPPQQFDLPLAKSRDVGERLRARKNRQKNQQQHLRQRVIHLAGLTMIRQPAEIVKETRRLRDHCKSCPVRIHPRPPPATQWMKTDSALQPFVTICFTRLPCPAHRKQYGMLYECCTLRVSGGDLRDQNYCYVPNIVILNSLERVKGIEPSYSAWKSP